MKRMTLVESKFDRKGYCRQKNNCPFLQFVRFTPDMEFAGNSFVINDILNYVAMAQDVSEENPVDIFTMNLPATDVKSFPIFAISVNSANTIFVTGAL